MKRLAAIAVSLLLPLAAGCVAAPLQPTVTAEVGHAPALDATVARLRQGEPAAEEVAAAIAAHLKSLPAELRASEKVHGYGAWSSGRRLTAEAAARETALFELALAAGLYRKASADCTALGHHLVVHGSPAAERYLTTVLSSDFLTRRRVRDDLAFSLLAAGELGERLVVANCASSNLSLRKYCCEWLLHHAMYESSVDAIHRRIEAEPEAELQAQLLYALAGIWSPASLPVVERVIATTENDRVQAAAIFTFVELLGRPGIGRVRRIEPIGPKSRAARFNGIRYLRDQTTDDEPWGAEMGNNREFVERFGTIGSPAMRWLRHAGLLRSSAVRSPAPLSVRQKTELLPRLEDARGFGLEAVKGALFLSVEETDLPALLRIRAAGYFAPSRLSAGRDKSLGILIRRVRRRRGR